MFASSLRNYSDKGGSIPKLKPRLKSASSLSRVQEVFNNSVVLADKKFKARAKSATLPSSYNQKKNKYSNIVTQDEDQTWPPLIKTYSVSPWKKPLSDSAILTAVPYASQPGRYKTDIDRSLDYITEELGKSILKNKKDDRPKPDISHEKETRIRFYTYDSDVDSQEDGFELLESPEDLRDEGVERIDLPPSSCRIISKKTHNTYQQNAIRVIPRESTSYVSCPRCNIDIEVPVPVPISTKISTAFSPSPDIEKRSPPLSPPALRASPQPIWQAAHAVELTVPKMPSSSLPSPTLSLPSDTKVYYRSSDSFNTDDVSANDDQFLSAHSRPRPLSASFYCKKI